MNDALLIIDMQNDYFPGGKMVLSGIDKAAGNTRKLLDHYRSKNLPVFHVQHFSKREGATFLLPGTEGVEIESRLTPKKSEKVIEKLFPNSFRDTDLLKQLKAKNIDILTVCGAMSHMCVDSTVRAAYDLGFKCSVVSDACATKNQRFESKEIPAETVHETFMASLTPVFARLKTTEEILATE